MLGPRNAWKAAENDRELRRRGITVRKTIDGSIATACMEANQPPLFSDRVPSLRRAPRARGGLRFPGASVA